MRALMLSCLGLSALPARAVAAEVPAIDFEAYSLPNGLRVVLHEDHGAPLVTVLVDYGVGAADEAKGQSGFAHLFEHLMFQASAHVKEDAFFQTLEKIGARDVNAYTTDDRTVYFETVPAHQLAVALWLEADRMGFLSQGLGEASLENQKRVVENERFERVHDQPYGQVDMLIDGHLYGPDHALDDGVIGSEVDLARATLETARDFAAEFYSPKNAILVIAGDIDPRVAKELVLRYFGTLGGRAPDRPHRAAAQVPGAQIVVEEPVAQRARITLVWEGPPAFSDDAFDLELFAHVLSQSRVTRIGLVNWKERSIDALDARLILDGPGTLFRIDAIAAPRIDVELARVRLENILDTYKDYPPTEEEVFGAWNALETAALLALQRLTTRADEIAFFERRFKDPHRIRWRIQRWRRATVHSVRAVVDKYLGGRRLAVLAKPKGPKRAP